MKSYKEISFKYLKQHKKRSILTIIGIILAVSLFSGIGTFFYSLKAGLIESEKEKAGNFEVSYTNVKVEQIEKLKNNFEISNLGVSKSVEGLSIKGFGQDTVVNLNFHDSNTFKNIFNYKMVEGTLPKEKGEIILEKKAKKNLDKNIGDTIEFNTEKASYKIVGYFEAKFSISNKQYTALTLLEDKDINKDESYTVCGTLKEKKNKREVGKKIGENLGLNEKEISFNEGLLRYMLQDNNDLFNDSMKKVLIVVISIIIVCTVAVIYNAFNISVAERINQFGILRSIGATPAKIRRLVFREAFAMCIIAIPIGILAGYLGIYITIKLMSTSKFFLFDQVGFKVGIYPEVVIISSVLAIFTITLSVMGPARMAARVSPIDAIRNSAKLKKEKFKKRKTKIIKLLFGLEGEVAYKNIRRNNKRFLITVFSLMISLVMFVVFTSLSRISKEMGHQMFADCPFDAYVQNNTELNKDLINIVEEKEEVDKVYKLIEKEGTLFIERSFIKEEFYKKTGKDMPKNYSIGEKEYLALENVKYSSYDKNSLELAKKYLLEGSIDEKALKEGGVILINRNQVPTKDRKVVIEDVTQYKVGDTIKIPKLKEPFYAENEKDHPSFKEENEEAIKKGDFINAKVIAILNVDPIGGKQTKNAISLIFDEGTFKSNFGSFPLRNMGMRFKDKEAREKCVDYFEEKVKEFNESYYVDMYDLKNQMDGINSQIYVFIYGFITIVTIISIVNIINTITTGLLVRKSEFATLSAIGMTKNQLVKMVSLEGILHGIITSIFGSAVSYGLYILITRSSADFLTFTYKKPMDIFIIGALGVIVLTLLASMIPLRRLKNMSVVENIRAQE